MTATIKSKLKVRRGAYKIEVKGRLELSFAARRKLLPGEALRNGDLVTATDGAVLEIAAAEEEVSELRCTSSKQLARVAHELGSRHVPVEFGEGRLRIARDAGLESSLKSLGAEVNHLSAPFDPDPETYEHGHKHDHDHGEDHRHSHDHGHGAHGHKH